ncbi:hypothetical protein EVJ58_g9732 [Rhodofomes roseus]|uniref:Isochorismatase-like domain-containing protein n=1 Tax=Rhodofomes roseus TaxID=34475 RepID=A0A4Y9XS57_9APHY|nr:hypothetical protein EVJ58_g9732 [Rhodofomes roseus]
MIRMEWTVDSGAPIRSRTQYFDEVAGRGRVQPECCQGIGSRKAVVCSPEGYIAYLGYPVDDTRATIPKIAQLLEAFRKHGYPVYHTREGHRPDLSTLSSRELFRSRNNASGLGIGDRGPLGRLLIRGELGHDIIPELYPLPSEPVIDKPGRSAFAYTDFELLLKVRGITKLVICGVTTDVCVHSTMREGNDRG